jgi:LacI family transcriptional regulator
VTSSTNIGLAVAHGFGYYRGVLRGVWHYVEGRPDWELTSIAPDPRSLRVPRRFRPDGLVVAANTKGLTDALSSWRRPLVNVSAVFARTFPSVGVDDDAVGRLAADHFSERGLRRFAFVGPPRQLFSVGRREGFRRALGDAGHDVACFESRGGREFDPHGQRWDLEPAVRKWLRGLPKPVGVFAPNDLWGAQVVLACRGAGLRVPEDVAILGVDDDDLYCELARPRLSSIRVPAERIGFEAVSLLERLLAGGLRPDKPILLPPTGVNARRSSEVLAIEDLDVTAAVRFIRDHPDRRLCVADVARHVSVGRRTLERRCRAALGTGLAEEIRRVRLERAKSLLVGTELPAQAVAVRAGFTDYRHMALAFRKRLGATPTVYRRRFRSLSGGRGST